jgi:membrane protein implicated in regulation of membrane protease activity
MDFKIIFWHWLILGMALVAVEIILPSFISLWFGLAGLLIGLLLWIFPDLSFSLQITIWAITSAFFTWLWFKLLKPLSVDKTLAGLSREAIIGQTGQVILKPNENSRGKLRFSVPIMGSEEWVFISEDSLELGQRVRVTDISGNSLIVVKH